MLLIRLDLTTYLFQLGSLLVLAVLCRLMKILSDRGYSVVQYWYAGPMSCLSTLLHIFPLWIQNHTTVLKKIWILNCIIIDFNCCLSSITRIIYTNFYGYVIIILYYITDAMGSHPVQETMYLVLLHCTVSEGSWYGWVSHIIMCELLKSLCCQLW